MQKNKSPKGIQSSKIPGDFFYFASNAFITITNADLIGQYGGIHRTCKNSPQVIRYMCQFQYHYPGILNPQ